MSSGRDEPAVSGKGRGRVTVRVTGTDRLAAETFEIRFQRPKAFDFLPGQKIGVIHRHLYRDYSLTGPRPSGELAICVRRIAGGALSPILATARTGDRFDITPAFGYFRYQLSGNPAVFVATGTGIAPFAAFAHAGVKGYHLLHGVRSQDELYYRDLLSSAAAHYTPCLSGLQAKYSGDRKYFYGRVTDFLELQLSAGAYDFYLCGRSEMLRDATRIIDRRFDGSRIFFELFF